jgi:surfeit locus 1 family protein
MMTKRNVLLVGLIGLIPLALCVWQIQRYEQKQDLIQERSRALQTAAIPLDNLLAASSTPADMAYRAVSVPLTLSTPLKPVFLGPRNTGQGLGYAVLVSGQITDGTWKDYHLPVIIGFIFTDKRQKPLPALKPLSPTVSGRINLDEPHYFFSPDNQPSVDFWARLYASELHAFWGHKRTLPVSLALDTPLLGEAYLKSIPPLPDNHLQYAMTWGILALVWYAIMYFRLRNT